MQTIGVAKSTYTTKEEYLLYRRSNRPIREARRPLMLSLVREGEGENICIAIKGADIMPRLLEEKLYRYIYFRRVVREVSAIGLIGASGKRYILEAI